MILLHKVKAARDELRLSATVLRRAVADAIDSGTYRVTDIAESAGISRPTAYRWRREVRAIDTSTVPYLRPGHRRNAPNRWVFADVDRTPYLIGRIVSEEGQYQAWVHTYDGPEQTSGWLPTIEDATDAVLFAWSHPSEDG